MFGPYRDCQQFEQIQPPPHGVQQEASIRVRYLWQRICPPCGFDQSRSDDAQPWQIPVGVAATAATAPGSNFLCSGWVPWRHLACLHETLYRGSSVETSNHIILSRSKRVMCDDRVDVARSNNSPTTNSVSETSHCSRRISSQVTQPLSV